MFRSDRGGAGYEQQARFIQERITGVEKHFAELCAVFSDYTRKTARLRDKGDEVARVLSEYGAAETVNKSLSSGLLHVSATLSAVEEYRNATVQRLETKVVGELAQYDSVCRHAREELKHTLAVRERELSRRKVLEKARERQPFNRQQITYAESELLKASAEMSRTARSLGEQTALFERRKLQQLKGVLREFLAVEMAFHAKSLELMTAAHQQVADVDDKADLEDLNTGLTEEREEPVNFRRKLRSPERSAAGGALGAPSGSLASLLAQPSAAASAAASRNGQHSVSGTDESDDTDASDSDESK